MSSELLLSQILANMEAQIASVREREAFHAEQEGFHREQRTAKAAELAAILQSYEALKAAVGPAVEIASRFAPAATPPPPREQVPNGTKFHGKLVERVVESLPAGEVFNASRVAGEIGRRYILRKPIDPRVVSNALRRLLDAGEIHLAQKGVPHHEALYTKK